MSPGFQGTIDSEGFKGGTRGAPIMPRDTVSRTANVERTGGHKCLFRQKKNSVTFYSKIQLRVETYPVSTLFQDVSRPTIPFLRMQTNDANMRQGVTWIPNQFSYLPFLQFKSGQNSIIKQRYSQHLLQTAHCLCGSLINIFPVY